MKWEFSTAQRIRTAIGLVVVFLLILSTNLIDRNHFDVITNSLTSVYNDRLVAKSHLYNISRQLQQKQMMAVNNTGSVGRNEQANDSIRVLIGKYANTQLIEKEARIFEMFQENMVDLLEYENSYLEEGVKMVPPAENTAI